MTGKFPYIAGSRVSCRLDQDDIMDEEHTFIGTVVYVERYTDTGFSYKVSIKRDDCKSGSGAKGTWVVQLSPETAPYIKLLAPPDWDNEDNI
jgi:hypothetical protein